MTVNQYLSNPYGKGSAISSVGLQRDELNSQYEKFVDKITCKIYLYRNIAYFHVVIPSRRNDQQSYDVVVEIPFQEKTELDIDLSNRDFKVFSNCPSFIFTYAHVFRGKKMICEWLVDKYDEAVRKKAPGNSNPFGIIGFERSVYLALRYLKLTGKLLGTTIRLDPYKPFSRDEIAKNVRTQEQIMSKAKAKVQPKKEDSSKPAQPKKNSNSTHTTKGVTSTKKTGTVGKVKKTKSTSKI